MSHSVDPHDLAEAAQPYGSTPFLLYCSADGSARINHVRARVQNDAQVTIEGFGRGIERLLSDQPDLSLSLLWAGSDAESFSLIADGTATVDGEQLIMTITNAVFHRPAPTNRSASC